MSLVGKKVKTKLIHTNTSPDIRQDRGIDKDEWIGVLKDLPVVGAGYTIYGERMFDYVRTSTVQSIESNELGIEFKTKNSTYRIEPYEEV